MIWEIWILSLKLKYWAKKVIKFGSEHGISEQLFKYW